MRRVVGVDEDELVFARADLDEVQRGARQQVLAGIGDKNVDALGHEAAVVGAFIVAAVVTPPDVVSQLALAIPMCLLYELGILAARFVSRPAPPEYVVVDPAEEAKMDAEMDSAEEEFRKLSGK